MGPILVRSLQVFPIFEKIENNVQFEIEQVLFPRTQRRERRAQPRTSHTRLAHMVTDITFDCRELGQVWYCPAVSKLSPNPYGLNYSLVVCAGGGRKRLPKFKFSAKFPIGLHVILQIQIKKFENDCYLMWKIILTENPSRCNLAPLLK